MFLASSLKERLKKCKIDNESDNLVQAKFPYKIPPRDPRLLLTFRESDENNNTFFSTQKLQTLSRKEWENTFSLDKLYSKWNTRVNMDFDPNCKIFYDPVSSPEVIKSKQEIKDSVDPDILELKKRNWNISSHLKDDVKKDLKKKIFEISSGLKDFKIIPLKGQKVIEGVDSRDHSEVDGGIWNVSSQITIKDIQKDDNIQLKNAKRNSNRYWIINNKLRKNEKPFPIPEEKKKIEVIRYFKRYRTPFQKTNDFYKAMKKIKANTYIEREDATKRVIYRNPGSEKYPEKINALVLKEMYNIYKYKYNELTGKLSKEELKKKQNEKNRFKWSDIDLARKILALKKLKGEKIFEKEGNKTCKSEKSILKNIERKSFSQEFGRNNSMYLLPLVSKGTEIHLEEEKIQEKINEEFKKRKKKELLLNKKSRSFYITEKFESKYPIDKINYETIKQAEKEENTENNTINYNEDNNGLNTNNTLFQLNNNNTIRNQSNYLDYLEMISKSTNCGPFFLEAYQKIAQKEINRINTLKKKNKKEKSFEYVHPGAYREFIFMENNNDDNQKNISLPKKEVKTNLWSCCMNSDKNSKGCEKRYLKKVRWVYSP